MSRKKVTAVILAAGKGTRMKSNKAKVLHELFFKPMLHHVLDSVMSTSITQTAIIVGHQQERVLESLKTYNFTPVYQEEQLGTGHAVRCAEKACDGADQIMILCGDTPLIRPETLQAMIKKHLLNNAVISLMTTQLDNPFGYGRIISDEYDYIKQIVEQKDATAQQRLINEINTGIYLVERNFLFSALRHVGTDNSQKEIYLTDIVQIAANAGYKILKFRHNREVDVLGVNSRVELAKAHQELQMRHNQDVMLSGVTMHSPQTTLISPDSTIGKDCLLESGVQITGNSVVHPGSFLATGVVVDNSTVGTGCHVGAHSVLQNYTLAEATELPPLSCKQG